MSFIKNWLRDDIQAMDAYPVSEVKNGIKLDAMESPFALSDELKAEYSAVLAQAHLNRYPDSNTLPLQKTLRTLMNIPAEFGILFGNGSDELIQLLAMGCESGAPILSVEPSFVMYHIIAKFTHLNHHCVALTDEFEIDLSATLSAIQTHTPKLIFIAYPNNPTGNLFDRGAIEQIIQSTEAMVVLDEAYYAYADDSFLGDIVRYPNLVVLRTLSKIGFAGLRLGLLIACWETVIELDKLRLPYNINTLSQISANFLLKQQDNIRDNANIIIQQRAILSKLLSGIAGLVVYPSKANFILFKAPNANALFAYLKDNGILIKNLSRTANLTDCLRVTIGTAEQNQAFMRKVEAFYG